MKKVFSSLTIIGLTLALAVGFSRAFFSDTETSANNTLTAGKVDLLIDNTSYYNGQPNVGTSFGPSDLPGKYFFNFTDIKPGDLGEDTISLHVDDNSAWACMKITLTENDDETCNEPEQADDPTCNEPDDDLNDGELGGLLEFVFWADDGDNVLETDEVGKIFREGLAVDLFDGEIFALSDSLENIWGDVAPLDPEETYYIGKAWCFGNLEEAALGQDNFGPESGRNPSNSTGGVTCDGTLLDNASQTDILLADVEFTAEQS